MRNGRKRSGTELRGAGFQRGLTITELMVTVALGMTVISSILLGYLATYRSSLNTLSASRLNQDMGALMSIITSELRRDGYTANATTPNFPLDNAFNQANSTALEVFNSMAGNVKQAPLGSGSCIVFAYDRDEDRTVDAEELNGFRLNGNVVEMRTVGNTADPDSCASASNTWVALTDPGFIVIDELTFDLSGSQCFNSREPDTVDNDANGTVDNPEEADCYAFPPTAGSGDLTVETREIAITIRGSLAEDSFVSMTLASIVRVRNDWVRQR